MAKYFIANRSVVGVVTINKEALDFKNRGFAPTDNDETYEAAKCLKTLGYEPFTEEEFKKKFQDNYNEFVGSSDINVKEAKKTLEESEKDQGEQVPAENGTVETPAVGEQASGEVETETGEKENLEPAKTEQKEESFEIPESSEEKAKLTRSIKAKLADAKRKWDSSEDEEEKAKLKNKIETLENQLKQLQ